MLGSQKIILSALSDICSVRIVHLEGEQADACLDVFKEMGLPRFKGLPCPQFNNQKLHACWCVVCHVAVHASAEPVLSMRDCDCTILLGACLI